MKSVLDLTKAITDGQFYKEQFENNGNEKNILFLEPQLTSKHLYKFILPYFCFYDDKVYTAITGLGKYDPYRQIVGIEANLNEKEILWADYIVIPFTTMDLSKEYGIYSAIREVNPDCKIVFFVDFNFYELSQEHPHKELFSFQNIVDIVEKNILFSDLCLTNNIQLRGYLIKKFTQLVESKYVGVENIDVNFGTIPYLIDEQIVLQNVEFEYQKPEPVINKEIFIKVAEVADEIKKEDLEQNKDKAKKLNSKNAPRKVSTKTKKVVAKRGRKKKEEEKPIVEETKIEPIEIKKLPKKYNIGIICSGSNLGDIKEYNEEFKKINDKYGDDVNLIFIGYDYDEDKNKGNILEGVNFEYVKQVSIIHFFKQLQALQLDLVFIPLKKNLYNITSENINKYLECGILNIPVICLDIAPYNQIILNQRNGFVYENKESFLNDLDAILNNKDLIKSVSEQCKKDVLENYSYNNKTIDLIHTIYI
jgi:glycosyltransferase involved in cell wall biosynthesis